MSAPRLFGRLRDGDARQRERNHHVTGTRRHRQHQRRAGGHAGRARSARQRSRRAGAASSSSGPREHEVGALRQQPGPRGIDALDAVDDVPFAVEADVGQRGHDGAPTRQACCDRVERAVARARRMDVADVLDGGQERPQRHRERHRPAEAPEPPCALGTEDRAHAERRQQEAVVVHLGGREHGDDRQREHPQRQEAPPVAAPEDGARDRQRDRDRAERLSQHQAVRPGHPDEALRAARPLAVVVRDLGGRAAERAAHLGDRVRRADREHHDRRGTGEHEPGQPSARTQQADRDVRGCQQHARELHGRGGAHERARRPVARRAPPHAREAEEREQHERLQHDVRPHHVRRLHRDRADGDEQRGRKADERTAQARAEQAREADAADAERGDHGAGREVGVGTEARRPEEREHGRGQIEEEAGVLVEAVVEVARGEHPAGVLDEVPLVDVRLVAQPVVERAEAQDRGQREDAGESRRLAVEERWRRVRGGARHGGRDTISVRGNLDGSSGNGRRARPGPAGGAGGRGRFGGGARAPRGRPAGRCARPDGAVRPVVPLRRARARGDGARDGLDQEPGLMRWEYSEPESKTFVSDGSTSSSTCPRTGRSSSRPGPASAASPSLLLSGGGDILDAVRRRPMEPPPGEGVLRLRLIPRKPEPESSALPGRGAARAASGRSRWGRAGQPQPVPLRGIRENVGLSDKTSGSRCPPGVEVIQG